MSPEQVRGAEIDRRTDVFALGVVLWEATTSQRLFRMDTDLDTLEKVQACVVPLPSSVVHGYPPELESVVMKALAKNKQDRFQTARELSRALQTYLMRSGKFVDSESVAAFVREVFSDRIQKREAHLAWASEVTSTVNVDRIRGNLTQPSTEREADSHPQPKPGASPFPPDPPGSPEPRPTSQKPQSLEAGTASLLDDDEEFSDNGRHTRAIGSQHGHGRCCGTEGH